MRLALLTIAMALAGCNQNESSACGRITQYLDKPPKGYEDNLTQARACVEQWSARLGRGSDPARDIAQAVIGTCIGSIMAYHRSYNAKFGDKADPNVFDENDKREWLNSSMFVVMQVRAGDCYKAA